MPENKVQWLKIKVENSRFNYDDLADELKVTRTTIWRWLNEKSKVTDAKLKMIADAIGVSLKDQFEDLSYLYEDRKIDYKDKYESVVEENKILRDRLEKYERAGR